MTDPAGPDVPDLIGRLESADAFERRDAQQELERRTHLDLGFRWSDPPEARAEAVERWKAWWRGQRRGERGAGGKRRGKAVDIGGAVVGLEQLKQALQGIPPEQLEAQLAAILEKMKEAEARRRTCERCGESHATVHITERGPDGVLIERNLCEDCFGERAGGE